MFENTTLKQQIRAPPISFRAPQSPLLASHSSFPFKKRDSGCILSTTTTTSRMNRTPPSLVSLTPSPSRKLLPTPPSGKYVREDYLVKKLSAEEIKDLLKGERSVPLIIDFYATWCGPCILMAQELEMLAVEYENTALIVKVDTDDEYEFALDMQVRGLPTLYFISPNPSKDAIRTEGLIPIQMMRDVINNDM